MKRLTTLLAILTFAALCGSWNRTYQISTEEWGFFGHKRINRLAVFTLPPPLIGFFKQNIEFVTDHAVDPDKRRYATKIEGFRHYIDIDHWGKPPFPDLPRRWIDALVKYTDVFLVQNADTLQLFGDEVATVQKRYITLKGKTIQKIFKSDSIAIEKQKYYGFFVKNVLPQYGKDDWMIPCNAFDSLFTAIPHTQALPCATSAFAIDGVTEWGVVPWHLETTYRNLVEAFAQKEPTRILRLATEFGHYVGDSHVPLHTTENYNGQLTNQVGIHGFWESRIPELFSQEYDVFVGKAQYINNTNELIWNTVISSHILVDSVLNTEKRLSVTFPQDKQYCYEPRLDQTIRMPCEAYAKAFSDEMQGMVEERFTLCIKTLGSLWYSAWVDAGQPELPQMGANQSAGSDEEEIDRAFRAGGAMKGRDEGN